MTISGAVLSCYIATLLYASTRYVRLTLALCVEWYKL